MAALRRCADRSGAPAPDVRVTGVTLDSRAVRPGDLYAALPGARVHGADFAADGRRAGAVAVLTDAAGAAPRAAPASPCPRVVVPQPRAVLGELAALVYGAPGRPHLRMVGITGTNGKTTTAYLVDSAWRALGHATGLIGTVETRIGDERVKSVRTTPEAPDLHALLAVMRRAGRRHLLDGGLQPRARAAPGGRRSSTTSPPSPTSSQDHLDFHADDGATTSPPRPRCSPRSARAAASSASTTSGAGGWPAEADRAGGHA